MASIAHGLPVATILRFNGAHVPVGPQAKPSSQASEEEHAPPALTGTPHSPHAAPGPVMQATAEHWLAKAHAALSARLPAGVRHAAGGWLSNASTPSAPTRATSAAHSAIA